MSISLRLAAWYTSLLGTTLILLSVLVYVTILGRLDAEVESTLRLRAEQVQRLIATGSDEILDARDFTAHQLDLTVVEEFATPGVYVQVLDEQGEVVTTSANLVGGQLPLDQVDVEEALRGKPSLITLPAGQYERLRVLTVPVVVNGRVVGALQVGESLHIQGAVARQMRNFLFAGTSGTLALAALSGWLLSRRLIRPVSEMTRAAQHIATTGDFSRRVPANGPRDEIEELARTFNLMIERVERTLSAHRQFTADASHELRGPLTVLKGNVGLLRRGIDEGLRQECVSDMDGEISRMSRIVSDLLFLTQVEAGLVIDRRPVDLTGLVTDVHQQARLLARGQQVQLDRLERLVVVGDEMRLRQLLMNIVENAIHYTSAPGKIALALWREQQWARLEVADTGAGIPGEHLPHIFDRFYRADRARSRAKGGTGLGLAIVKHIAEAHGGSVSVESQLGVGSTFTVRLPLATPQTRPQPI